MPLEAPDVFAFLFALPLDCAGEADLRLAALGGIVVNGATRRRVDGTGFLVRTANMSIEVGSRRMVATTLREINI